MHKARLEAFSDGVIAITITIIMAGFAYFLLARALLKSHGHKSEIAKAIGTDFKGKISVVIYAVSIPVAFKFPLFSLALYILVALIWFIPDKRMEKVYKS